MTKRPTRAFAIVLPLFMIGALQLTGCTSRSPSPPPPGGAYLSKSGGANYDQSVSLGSKSGETIGHIAGLSLRNIHRSRTTPTTIYLTSGASGVHVSSNDGESWQILPQPLVAATDFVELTNGTLLVSGTNVDGEGIVARSLDQANSWQIVLTIPALHRKKAQIFEIIKPPSPPPVYVSSIVANPFIDDQVYATTSTGEVLVGEQSGKLWRSLSRVESDKRDPLTNQVIASIRKVIPSPHTIDELLLVTTSGKLVRLVNDKAETIDTPGKLAVVDTKHIQQFPDALFIGTSKGAFISKDRGTTWQELNLPVSTAAAWRNIQVRVSPNNPNRLFISIDAVLYRSEDGGQTFNTLSLNLPNHIITGISINPDNAANVLIITSPAQT